jgi:hypothetical protein
MCRTALKEGSIMRVFKLSDGSSWTARLHDPHDAGTSPRVGWEAILFAESPHAAAQRLVYRPAGWLSDASLKDLAEALREGVVVRTRWGE